MKLFGSITELVSAVFRKNSQTITLRPNQVTTYTASRDIQTPPQDADSVLVSADATQTLTNKSISGSTNTITNVSLTAGVTGVLPAANGGTGQNSTATFPTSGVVVTEAATETLTNKSISGSTNTITNVSLTTGVTGTLPIGNGGTGQTTANPAFNALSPLTTKGDIVAYSTVNARLGVGTDGQFLTADSAQTLGVKWSSPAGTADSPADAKNYSLLTSVSANALTIALKDKAGSDPSAGSPVTISVRNATATSGTYNVRSVTAALSLVISSGSTLGHFDGKFDYIYIYVLDNAGTLELAASSTRYDDRSIQSTTAEGGAGAADSITGLYSTAARSNVPVRFIGRLASVQTTAGTWASQMQEVSVGSQAANTDTYGRLNFVPTSGAFGTITNAQFYGVRRGRMLQVVGSFKGGTMAGGATTIQLPPGMTINTSAISSVYDTPFGFFHRHTTPGAGVYSFGGTVFYDLSLADTGKIRLSTNTDAGQTGTYLDQIGTSFLDNDVVNLNFEIPINEWST